MMCLGLNSFFFLEEHVLLSLLPFSALTGWRLMELFGSEQFGIIEQSLLSLYLYLILKYGIFNHGFWYFARSRTREIQAFPRNPTKFPKKREIPRNPTEVFPNTCRQNIFSTYLGYETFSIHRKRPNLSWNFVTATRKQCPKTTRRS